MPAHRKPTALLKSSGSFDHNRSRYATRLGEPKPTGPLGAPPKHFDKEHAALWKELAQAAPPGVLTNSDRWLVELACSLMHQLRAGTASAAALAQLTTLLGKMGMSPADRNKVQAGPPKPEADDPWAAFGVQ